MNATEFFQVIAGLWGPLFVITTMLAIGPSLITSQARLQRMNLCRVSDHLVDPADAVRMAMARQ